MNPSSGASLPLRGISTNLFLPRSIVTQGRRKQFGFGTAKWDTSTAEGSVRELEARSADLYISREAQKIYFTVIFQLPGWGLVAPSCFALHCCLVSVQSVTVSLSTWKGNVRCAGSPRLLITSIRRRVFRCCYSTSWLHPFLNRTR